MNEHCSISKITLGTVQLGLPYGIANKDGQPTRHYSHDLMQYALLHGICSLDTARIYGEAEEIIGSFKESDSFTIISKFKLSDGALDDKGLAIAEARKSISTSCSLLKKKFIPIVLFHKDKNQPIEKVANILPDVFKTLISEGWIGESGISVYSGDELKYISVWENIHAVQVPLNVFDTRLLNVKVLQALATNNIKVFARSIYLQGLLVMEGSVPPRLSAVEPYLQKLNAIAANAKRPVKEVIFSFVKDTPCVTSIVIGAETIEQLKENIQLLNTPPLTQKTYAEIKECFKSVPEQIITPAFWEK